MTPYSSAEWILLRRALSKPCGQECVDWAVSLIEAGRDGPELLMLAGLQPPFNPFEVESKRDRVLAEQAIPEQAIKSTAQRFASRLLTSSLEDIDALRDAFRTLNALHVELSWEAGLLNDFMDFYLLSYAQQDLEAYGYQYYWPDADSANIDTEMRNKAISFLAE